MEVRVLPSMWHEHEVHNSQFRCNQNNDNVTRMMGRKALRCGNDTDTADDRSLKKIRLNNGLANGLQHEGKQLCRRGITFPKRSLCCS